MKIVFNWENSVQSPFPFNQKPKKKTHTKNVLRNSTLRQLPIHSNACGNSIEKVSFAWINAKQNSDDEDIKEP